MSVTKVSDLVNPQVMADMISAKIETKITVSPFAKVDDTLVGVAGDKITVPQYAYIGDAEDVAEGVACDTTKLSATTTEAQIKKAMKAVELSDEAVLSGYGNPVGEANHQLASAIAGKIDIDAMSALQTAQRHYYSAGKIGYDGIVDAVGLFAEEGNIEKVMFVHPDQVTHLRHDDNFISKEKYGGNVVMSGEIGTVAGARVVPSKRVTKNTSEHYVLTAEKPSDWSKKYKTYFTKAEDDTYTAVADASAPEWTEGTYYKKYEAGTMYICPIVQLEDEENADVDELPALTIYLKRDTNVEAERHTLKRTTTVSVDKFYTVALSNASKVVLAQYEA